MAERVIIVDDDRDTREALRDVLEREGFDVTLATNGLKLISNLHVDKPDVIVLDVLMSWINGLELCRAIKKNPEFCQIPVVFISGRTSREDIRKGLDMGAQDYFTKPIDIPRLVERLRTLVASRPHPGTESPPL